MSRNILDRLADAAEASTGLKLSANDVEDILDEISEIELMRELDARMGALQLDRVVSVLTGMPSRMIH